MSALLLTYTIVGATIFWLAIDNVLSSYELYRRGIVGIYGLLFDTLISSLGILLVFSVIVSLVT